MGMRRESHLPGEAVTVTLASVMPLAEWEAASWPDPVLASDTEDTLFAVWRSTNSERRGPLFSRLYRLLARRAYAICCAYFGAERPGLVQHAIWWALVNEETYAGGSVARWFDAIVVNICAAPPGAGGALPLDAGAPFDAVPADALQGLTTADLRLLDLKREGLHEAEIGTVLHLPESAVGKCWSEVLDRVAANLPARAA
jgi:hypothetical protein